MKKAAGEVNKLARTAAVSVLAGFKGKNVKTLNSKEQNDLLIAILQLLGLADASGNIK